MGIRKKTKSYFTFSRDGFFIQGFSLVEVLVALFVISIGLIVVLQVFPTGLNVEKYSQLETQATLAAQEKTEELLTLSFSEITIGQTTESPLPSPYQRFNRMVKITYVDTNLQEVLDPTGLKKIEVSVFWSSPLKVETKQIKLATLYAEK